MADPELPFLSQPSKNHRFDLSSTDRHCEMVAVHCQIRCKTMRRKVQCHQRIIANGGKATEPCLRAESVRTTRWAWCRLQAPAGGAWSLYPSGSMALLAGGHRPA